MAVKWLLARRLVTFTSKRNILNKQSQNKADRGTGKYF